MTTTTSSLTWSSAFCSVALFFVLLNPQHASALTTVTPPSQQVGSAAQRYTVNVIASGNWSVSSPSWIEVNPSSGSDPLTTVTITVYENYTLSDWTGTLSFSGIPSPDTHVVSQSAATQPALRPGRKTISSSQQQYDVAFNPYTTVPFTGLAAAYPWITIVNNTDTFKTSATIQVASNNTGDQRFASIAFGSKSHSLTQNPSSWQIGTLENGISKTGLSGSPDSSQFFKIIVPAGQKFLSFTTNGGTGDCDLYVKKSSLPIPTLEVWDPNWKDDWDARPFLKGNDESVILTSNLSGTWYVLVQGFGPSQFTGVTLTASYSETNNQITPLTRSISANAQSYAVTVTSTEAWSVIETLSWATVNTSSGSGNGTVVVTVDENTTGSTRTGSMSIAGIPHTLTQSNTTSSSGGGGGSGDDKITTSPGFGSLGVLNSYGAYWSFVWGELRFPNNNIYGGWAYSMALHVWLATNGSMVYSADYGELTPSSSPGWVTSSKVGPLRLHIPGATVAAPTTDPWAWSGYYGWLLSDRSGNGVYFWNHWLQGWLASTNNGALWSYGYGWLSPVASGIVQSSSLGTLYLGDYGGYVWSPSYGWLISNNDASASIFWSSWFGWIASTNNGKVYSFTLNRWL